MMRNVVLRNLINSDKKNYLSDNYKKRLYDRITCQNNYRLYKQLKVSRKYVFYRKNQFNLLNKIKFIYYSRLNNIMGLKNNVEINCYVGKNFKMYHGGIVTTRNAIIGDNVILHGMNCIGIKGKDLDMAPIIGNNVEIGYGSVIFGKIVIGDNIIIGANSVVTQSFTEKGIIIAGNPARKIGEKNKYE